MILNIADLSRYAKSQRDQAIGQTLGYGPPYLLLIFCGILIVGSAYVHFGEVVWDLAPLLALRHPGFSIPVAFSMALGVLNVNIVANIVSPGNDIANLWPEKISYKMGAYTAIALSIVTCPWRLFSSPSAFMYTFLSGYAMVTGAIFGIMALDYYVLKRRSLALEHLYLFSPESPAHFTRGFNLAAWAAMGLGIAPLVPGFVHTFGVDGISSGFVDLYDVSWLTAVGFAGALYLAFAALFLRPGENNRFFHVSRGLLLREPSATGSASFGAPAAQEPYTDLEKLQQPLTDPVTIPATQPSGGLRLNFSLRDLSKLARSSSPGGSGQL